MDLLDETVGAENWQRHHGRDNANCIVSIWDETKKQWIMKEDTGTESNTEKEKGLAADSFKRACVNWGIGRELYSAPKIIVWGNPDELKYKKFSVKSISYTDTREIAELVIVDENDIIVYGTNHSTNNKATAKQSTTIKATSEKLISDAQRKRLFAIANAQNDLLKQVINKYGYDKTEHIKMSDYDKICKEIEEKVNTI